MSLGTPVALVKTLTLPVCVGVVGTGMSPTGGKSHLGFQGRDGRFRKGRGSG